MTTKIIPISQARANIFKIVEEINKEHYPIIIKGKKNDAVLLSLDDWNAIQETLYLTSIPNMKESIIEGLNTPVEECETELPW
ncbi:MAG: type II toxin-antitoxin system Phd/YefM family antitoxin [Epsilonproteobacteria bacterium]|nr:type II toxin-antitoxin system Phd/YefM family antitoxin [Campylobacterota bacterium]